MRLRTKTVTPFALLGIALLSAACGGNSDEDSASSEDALTRVCGASTDGAVQGVDVSYYQGDFNWAGQHANFGAARISDGTGFIDPTFPENWAHMKSAGTLRSAYQFFEPGEDEVAQANLVISKVGRLGDGDLPVMLDIEVTGGQSPATIRARAQRWLNLVEAGTGKKPFVYSYASFLQTNLGSGFGAYPLWIAGYGETCPSVPSGWNNWVVWQYSDGGGHLDHDVFNGNEAQLEALAGASGGGGAGGGSVPSVVEQAFQANTSSLWTVGSAGDKDWGLGMNEGTSPAIASLSNGGFEVAFQANTTSLWTVGSDGDKDWQLGMMAGTSPSIAALTGGGFEVAFQANTGSLWTVGTAGNKDWGLGMMKGSSPSITGLSGGGFEVAFEANTTSLWTVGDAGDKDWSLGMYTGSSPAITAVGSNGFEVAFEANTTSLWTVGSAGDKDWGLGMYAGTSPAITTLSGGGFQAAFEANTTDLWTVGDAGDKAWDLGMMPGTSPTIAGIAGGGFKASFEANTTDLWSAGTEGITDWKLGMMKGTSPSGS
ncbi:MAG: GH25 family lysozyme [Polyangiaceae bacterium]